MTVELNHPAIDELKQELATIEDDVMLRPHLATFIRLTCSKTNKATGAWRVGDDVCTLSAAYIGAKAAGWL